jgi:peptide/nickel transport system permease protein
MRPGVIDYVLRRMALGLVTLFGVALMVFLIMRVIPGDAAVMLSGAEAGTVTEAELAEVRAKLGLDKPLSIQFANWASNVATFDLGTSLRTGNPVSEDIARRFPYTLQIVVMAMLIAITVGMTAGMISATFAGSWADQIMRAFSIIGLAAPSFWIGLLIILALVWLFQWSAPLMWEPFWISPWASITQLFWPALAVGLRQLALISRMTRSIMLEVLGEDYIRTARAKGLSEWAVVMRHGLRNGLLPVVTLIGFEVSALFGGLIITETVFSVPGLGQYVVSSILSRDYPAAQGIVLILASIVVLGNLTVDLLYGWLDPRTRIQVQEAQ